ncbi:MAG: Omp28 family outer membrane lipoprotein [Prevotella sp.]|nr:Omp28 family outer membrane lipoprotein [Prevotella sp.]
MKLSAILKNKTNAARLSSQLLALMGILICTACSNIDEDERLIYVQPAEVNRCVIIEDFTGQRCVNCPNATAAITQLQEQYGKDNVIAVAIHSGPFAHRNSMSSPLLPLGTELGDEYYNHWGIEMQPGVLINRTGGPIYDPSQYAAAVNVALQQTSPLTINLLTDLSDNELTIMVQYTSLVDTDAKMQVWLTEDNIVDTQYMPDGTINREYVHNHVLRQSLTTDNMGDAVRLDSGDNLHHTPTILRTTLDESWKKEDLHLVVFFYTEKDGVLQAATCPVAK